MLKRDNFRPITCKHTHRDLMFTTALSTNCNEVVILLRYHNYKVVSALETNVRIQLTSFKYGIVNNTCNGGNFKNGDTSTENIRECLC